ncbi:acyltransferase [Tenacibaculum sp. A30]|uniref:acyltransferase n=1 Tax=Tenacibaculum sp. A30 TaxID=3442644 RepID=UPI003EC06860
MKHKLILIYAWLIRTCFFFVPDFPFTMRVRGFFYGLVMKKCGKDFQVTNNALLKGVQNFEIGSNVFIGNNTVIMGSGNLIIEDEVMIAPGTVIVIGNHTSSNKSFRYGKINKGEVKIGKGSWVGGNCTIAIGAELPSNSILGANSFLNKKFSEPDSLYAGVPSKFIKKI